MIVRGILTHGWRRQQFVSIDGEGPVNAVPPKSGAGGFEALGPQPATSLIHKGPDCVGATGERLEQHNMPEGLVPASDVVLVYKRSGSGDDPPA